MAAKKKVVRKKHGPIAEFSIKILTDVVSYESGETPHIYRIYWIDERAITALAHSDASALEIIQENKVKEDLLCWGAAIEPDLLEVDIRIGEKRIQVDTVSVGAWEGDVDIEEQNYLGSNDEWGISADGVEGSADELAQVVFGGIIPSSDPSDGQYLVIGKAPVLSMTMKVSIEVDTDDLTAGDFKLYRIQMDDSSIYDSIFYRTTDIEDDLRGIIYKGKRHELSVEYEAGPSELRFYSPDFTEDWDWEPDLERLFFSDPREGPRMFAQQKANILLHELRAYLEPEAFDQFLDAEEGSDSYRIGCVYEEGDDNSEYAEWYDLREINFLTWKIAYKLFWAGDPHGHSTFKGTECEVVLSTKETALDDFVNWVKERVDWEELEENWNKVMADESLKADIDMEPLFQVEA